MELKEQKSPEEKRQAVREATAKRICTLNLAVSSWDDLDDSAQRGWLVEADDLLRIQSQWLMIAVEGELPVIRKCPEQIFEGKEPTMEERLAYLAGVSDYREQITAAGYVKAIKLVEN